jgi:flagellar basal body P-ring formation protein FlgA
MKKFLLLLPVALVCAAHANPMTEDVADLDRRLAVATNARAVALDRRLRLAKCPEPLAIETQRFDAVSVGCASLGWKIRVPLARLLARETQAEPVIARGDAVEIIYEDAEFAASTTGVAVDDGAVGETIHVKITSSAAAIAGRVSGPGEVKIMR